MRKSRKIKALENQRGMPIRSILQWEFGQASTKTQVACNLGITPFTLDSWLLKLGMEVKLVLVPRSLESELKALMQAGLVKAADNGSYQLTSDGIEVARS